MMNYEFGDVVLIQFPFTNQQGGKLRPAAVVSSRDYNQHKPDLILVALTSQIRSPLGFGEALLQDWQSAGLVKPTTIKPVLFTSEKSIVARKLGQLNGQDQRNLKTVLAQVLG